MYLQDLVLFPLQIACIMTVVVYPGGVFDFSSRAGVIYPQKGSVPQMVAVQLYPPEHPELRDIFHVPVRYLVPAAFVLTEDTGFVML